METEKKGQHKHPVLRSCIKWSLYASISIWLGVTVFDQIEKHINVSFWGHIGAEKERQLSCIKDMYYMFVTKKSPIIQPMNGSVMNCIRSEARKEPSIRKAPFSLSI